jgi:predicted ATPase
MQCRLIIKDFGPIDFVDLNLRNVNVFIGPQASGKSAIAKIYTILKAPRKFIKILDKGLTEETSIQKDDFKHILEEYNLVSFLKSESEISFESELHNINYKDGELVYQPKLRKKIDHLISVEKDFDSSLELIKTEFKEISEKFIFFDIRVDSILEESAGKTYDYGRKNKFKKLSKQNFSRVIDVINNIENILSTNAALYIPAERNFINIIKNFSLNLIFNKVPIPKHILSFGAELEKSSIHQIDLSFLHEELIYKSVNGEDRIFMDDEHSIKLIEAASGIQSVLPILIPILSIKNSLDHRSFVIEEPELNLFPLAQYELIKLLESTRREAYWEDYGTIHTYTTHSPYILSAINNLLYANKVKTLLGSSESDKKLLKQVEKITSAEINPYYFTAYEIYNGKAESIFDRSIGLIRENYIDNSSDKMGDDFDALTEVMEKLKHTTA